MNGVSAKNLTCIAGSATILDDVTLTFPPGQLVGLIGPNGEGKSTLLRHLAGYLRPSSGAVAWNGRDLHLWSAADRGAASGYLPQHGGPAWDYSVREIVALGAARVGGRAGSLQHTLKAFDLVALADRRWSCLSGGERARAMLASVLATRPALVFADEPGASLDIRHRLDLMARFKAAAADAVVIVAMHDLDLAARYCDRIVLLDKGKVAADASAQAIVDGDVLEHVFGVRFQRQTLDLDRDCLLPIAFIAAR
ncbi:MAG: ABC transporter ATP-binding protein [Hyphomicrobiales bacterium]|nr:MAG: ABC transporter ATP-binding protein [Hyphomicrobiales bacterium]